jgi:RNA polymerase-binding transcription factor DksA
MSSDTTPTGADLRRLRDEAGGEVQALDRDLHGLFAAAQSSNGDDEHDPEGSTIAYERAQLTAVLQAARRRLADLDVALSRLAAGTYGVCERCGQAIPAERLVARPSARTCVGCA